VGIAVFDATLACSPSEFTNIAVNSGMEWIAVVPRDVARDRANASALASSFFDYHTMPVDRTRLLHSIGHAHGRALLRHSSIAAAEPAHGRFGMIGESSGMTRLFHELEKVMRARAPLLITGESGVGKELAARAVSLGSACARGPFVAVNCGALPDLLIESLLFGHEKGAFTGAHDRQIGSIEAAHQGIFFLDEIGDLPRAAQASLLRFLQESTVVRVGSTRELRVDARVIAATHMDLHEAVRAGRFREDLYYRLNVLNVHVPPLRERDADCILLARYFFRHGFADKAPGVRGLSEDAVHAIQRYPWPGNVRELMNRIQRAMVMCDGPLITAADLQLGGETAAQHPRALASAHHDTERAVIGAALEGAGYNVAAAARGLGISRVTLYRQLKRLQIQVRDQPKDLDL
jgi:DNA-binding NtrC family response regulator